ncbi:site-specific integrase [Paracoccus sphaerophysae]|uniref:Integrase n=1 Tax=Paracoccus sphaerophysae TaxID=690417 RepID=A0A099EWU4_9RHOB|nr:tyrosine-type recombinase/integrase [Paracoccus sphaerophysae]KGJ02451.1 integrase [Paracoccus sphaerophysae]
MVRKAGRKPYVREVKPGFLYFYRGGKYLHRFTAPEDTAEFDRQYWEVRTGKKAASRTSWKALIEDYRRSDRWTKLKPRTRADYEAVMAYIIKKNGDRDMTRLTRKDVVEAQRKNEHRTRFANYIPAVMSVLCEHAIDLGWIKVNPAKGVRKLAVPDERKQPHLPWPDAAVAKFRAEAGALERLIFEIGVGSVQRPGDWVGFTWGDYNPEGDGTLRLKQNKGGVELTLPCTPQLKAALDAAKAALPFAPMPSRPILIGKRGQPMLYRSLAEIMLAERKRLGLEDYDLHALRYRGVQELALSGCDDDEIASYSGHMTKAMIQKYAGEARQKMRAKQAAAKRSRT